MTGTRDYQIAEPGEAPLQITWATPDGKSRKALKAFLCDKGASSLGKYCTGCESQCAFGRAFIGMEEPKPRYRFQEPKALKLRILIAYLPDNSTAGEWPSIAEAARCMGVKHKSRIDTAILTGRSFMGLRWMWRLEE